MNTTPFRKKRSENLKTTGICSTFVSCHHFPAAKKTTHPNFMQKKHLEIKARQNKRALEKSSNPKKVVQSFFFNGKTPQKRRNPLKIPKKRRNPLKNSKKKRNSLKNSKKRRNSLKNSKKMRNSLKNSKKKRNSLKFSKKKRNSLKIPEKKRDFLKFSKKMRNDGGIDDIGVAVHHGVIGVGDGGNDDASLLVHRLQTERILEVDVLFTHRDNHVQCLVAIAPVSEMRRLPWVDGAVLWSPDQHEFLHT